MNWGLMVACVALVLGFNESARLASAYGIAVSGTMAITSLVFFEVMRKTWKWPAIRAVPLLVLFLSFDLPFFGANLLKFTDGGYIPILVGLVFFVIMVDWNWGRRLFRELMESRSVPLAQFIASLGTRGIARVPGTSIYLSSASGVPPVLALQAERFRSITHNVVLVTVMVEHQPQCSCGSPHEVEVLPAGFVRVTIHFGYMEIDPAGVVAGRARGRKPLPSEPLAS